MRPQVLLVLAAAASCAVPPADAPARNDPSSALIDAMRELADAPCPQPPVLYVIGNDWADLHEGRVVAVDRTMVAIRMHEPGSWPADVLHLLLSIGSEIKGDAVVVGRIGDVLICRYFPKPFQVPVPPELGDAAHVDVTTTDAMRSAWRRDER